MYHVTLISPSDCCGHIEGKDFETRIEAIRAIEKDAKLGFFTEFKITDTETKEFRRYNGKATLIWDSENTGKKIKPEPIYVR